MHIHSLARFSGFSSEIHSLLYTTLFSIICPQDVVLYFFLSKIVLVAIQDSADTYGSVAFSALRRLGAREPIILELRSSFALAGFAGSGLPSWVSQAQNKRYKGPSVLKVTIEGGNYQATLTCN